MLNLLRKKKIAKKIFYVLCVLIIPAFVIWGSSSVMNKEKTPNVAGMIFGKKISFEDYRKALLGWKTQIKLQYGEKAEEIAQAFFDPDQATWDRLILLQEAKKRKFRIQDQEVVKMITEIPFLQREGRFDPQTYELFLRYSLGIQPRSFEEEIRDNLLMAKVYEEVTKGASVTEAEIREAYEKTNIQSRVKYLLVTGTSFLDETTVEEKDIQDYYEKNKEEFRLPPQTNARYVGVEFKDESALKEKEAARVTLKKIQIDAQKIGLAQAAKAQGLEVKETGLFALEEPVPGLGWYPDLANLLFELPKGSLSSLVELSRGLYIFEDLEKKDAFIPSFDDVREKIKKLLSEAQAKQTAEKTAQDMLTKINNGTISLDQASEELKIPLKETPLFSKESYIPELGMAPALKEAAFSLSSGQIAGSIVNLEQGSAIIQSIEFVNIDEEKFQKEKEEFSKNLLEQTKTKIFNEFFDHLKKRADLKSFIAPPKT